MPLWWMEMVLAQAQSTNSNFEVMATVYLNSTAEQQQMMRQLISTGSLNAGERCGNGSWPELKSLTMLN